jgi:hypothetical protein
MTTNLKNISDFAKKNDNSFSDYKNLDVFKEKLAFTKIKKNKNTIHNLKGGGGGFSFASVGKAMGKADKFVGQASDAMDTVTVVANEASNVANKANDVLTTVKEIPGVAQATNLVTSTITPMLAPNASLTPEQTKAMQDQAQAQAQTLVPVATAVPIIQDVNAVPIIQDVNAVPIIQDANAVPIIQDVNVGTESITQVPTSFIPVSNTDANQVPVLMQEQGQEQGQTILVNNESTPGQKILVQNIDENGIPIEIEEDSDSEENDENNEEYGNNNGNNNGNNGNNGNNNIQNGTVNNDKNNATENDLCSIKVGTLLYYPSKKQTVSKHIDFDEKISMFTPDNSQARLKMENCLNKTSIHVFSVSKEITNIRIGDINDSKLIKNIEKLGNKFCSNNYRGIMFNIQSNVIENFTKENNNIKDDDNKVVQYWLCNPSENLNYLYSQMCLNVGELSDEVKLY